MASHVGSESLSLLLRYAWQSASAVYASFGIRSQPLESPEMTEESMETLIDTAISTYDEHAIKLIDACIREDALKTSPLFRFAASRAVQYVERG
jgi:hypothetical protein